MSALVMPFSDDELATIRRIWPEHKWVRRNGYDTACVYARGAWPVGLLVRRVRIPGNHGSLMVEVFATDQRNANRHAAVAAAIGSIDYALSSVREQVATMGLGVRL